MNQDVRVRLVELAQPAEEHSSDRSGQSRCAGDQQIQDLHKLDDRRNRLKRNLRRVAHAPVHQPGRSEEHTSELQSLMRISYAVFCLKKKNHTLKKRVILQYEYNQENT